MGYYLNRDSAGSALPSVGKANALIRDGGFEVSTPYEFVENLVCVIENGMFDAALYCYSEDEFREAKYPCGRKKRWIIHKRAAEISGYL
jgi:hypothetical protein